MDRKAIEFLFNLLNTPSPTGFESQEQRIWMTHVRPFADSVENDAYGNAWATLNGGASAARIMLEAHADEIGFMIQNVTESGFLYVIRIGRSDRAIARSKRLTILGDKGPVSAVTGNTAIHIRDKENERIPEVHELYLDIGASSREEVEERGIRVGHPAVYADTAEELFPGRLIGRAIDNRIGGFILSEVLANLSGKDARPKATLFAVNAVQEEIGGPGMRMISYRLEPSVAIVLDVTHATDSPGIDRNKHGSITLGNGPTVTHGPANHPMVVKRLISLANELHIPIQHEASSGTTGTDTDRVYQTKGGIPSALVSLPMRYMHSTVEMVDLVDVERCIQLLTHFVRSVTSKEEFIPKFL
ncbi:MAG TPA: M42 family metallopeptidase [Chthoniobacterales bacterium]|nr:M42 family metallopeptidase [Chthoniobacterales bacterium]